jgi:hypothetical protein
MNGLGSWFQLAIQVSRSVESSATDRWAERCSFLRVSSENQRSTRLSQDELVGVKWKWNRWWRSSYLLMASVSWVEELSSTT